MNNDHPPSVSLTIHEMPPEERCEAWGRVLDGKDSCHLSEKNDLFCHLIKKIKPENCGLVELTRQRDFYHLLSDIAQQHNVMGLECLLNSGLPSMQPHTDLLYFFVSKNSKPCVELLLDYQFDVNEVFLFQQNSLHLAVKHQSFVMVQMLLRRGGNMWHRDINQDTPFHYLCTTSCVVSACDMLQLFLNHAQPHCLINHFSTPKQCFFVACIFNQKDHLAILCLNACNELSILLHTLILFEAAYHKYQKYQNYNLSGVDYSQSLGVCALKEKIKIMTEHQNFQAHIQKNQRPRIHKI